MVEIERFSKQRLRTAASFLGALLLSWMLGPEPARASVGPWPSTVQAEAPSINTASPDLLDRAGFPALAGIAVDRRFESGVDLHAITFSVTPLGVARLFGHRGREAGVDRGSGFLGGAAARITIGGPLQFVDSLRIAHQGRET